MERNFKGVWIPAKVWLDQDLTLVEKALLAEIDSFTGNGRSFMKSNETIQTEYGISRNTISRSLRKLVERGFVDVTFNGRVRCVTTRAGCIPKMGRQTPQNGEAASPNDTSTNTRERIKNNTIKKKGWCCRLTRKSSRPPGRAGRTTSATSTASSSKAPRANRQASTNYKTSQAETNQPPFV